MRGVQLPQKTAVLRKTHEVFPFDSIQSLQKTHLRSWSQCDDILIHEINNGWTLKPCLCCKTGIVRGALKMPQRMAVILCLACISFAVSAWLMPVTQQNIAGLLLAGAAAGAMLLMYSTLAGQVGKGEIFTWTQLICHWVNHHFTSCWHGLWHLAIISGWGVKYPAQHCWVRVNVHVNHLYRMLLHAKVSCVPVSAFLTAIGNYTPGLVVTEWQVTQGKGSAAWDGRQFVKQASLLNIQHVVLC